MKFMHVADLHLDQSFEGLGKIPYSLATNLLKQNQQTMVKLVDEAIRHDIDFLLMVGDTFHQPRITIQTQNFFIQQLKRLEQQQIKVILSFGNHDYYQAHRYWFDFPKNVYLFDSEEIQTVTLETQAGETVAITGFSYEHRWLTESMTLKYPQRESTVDYHIGFFHGQVGENQYASFSPMTAAQKGYDYWALGHIHQPQIVQEQPPIIYAGSLIPHTQKEKDSGAYVLVTSDGNQLLYEWHHVANVAWLQEQLDVKQVDNMQSLINHSRQLFKREGGDYQLVKVKLENMSEKFASLLEDTTQKKELLYLLQNEIFEASNQKTWLYALETQPDFEFERFALPITQTKAANLLAAYQESERFQELMGDLYKNATSAQLVAIDDVKQAELIAHANSVFNESFAFRDEVTRHEN
ncbi:metallophosphoesterase family protein [Vagococcus zengguangii]|nr:DNA repair exonuclease [Vagococcus zengguangii]